jgi:hypothetical protein
VWYIREGQLYALKAMEKEWVVVSHTLLERNVMLAR